MAKKGKKANQKTTQSTATAQGTKPPGDQGSSPPQGASTTGGQSKSDKNQKQPKFTVEPTAEERKRLDSVVDMLKQWILILMDHAYNFTVELSQGPIDYARLLLFSIASAMAGLRQELLDDIRNSTENIVKELRFIDDGLFRVAVKGQMELIQALLRDITGDYELTLKAMYVQQDLSFPARYHNLIVDVYCVTTNNELIIIEVQKKDRGEDYPRSLFEGYAAGFNSLSSGDSYKDLKPVYVVFLTDCDVFGTGELLHKDEMTHFPAGIKSDVKPLFKTFYLNCAYVEDGNKTKGELRKLRAQLAKAEKEQEPDKRNIGLLKWRIEENKTILTNRNQSKRITMKQYGIDKDRWSRLETWGCDFMAKDSADITRSDMADLMQLVKESGEVGVSIMSMVEWKAMQAAREEGREVGREEGRKEEREENAVKLLVLGVDPNKISEAMGFSAEKLKDLQARAAR